MLHVDAQPSRINSSSCREQQKERKRKKQINKLQQTGRLAIKSEKKEKKITSLKVQLQAEFLSENYWRPKPTSA